ncbi:MAG: tyrosine-type recombinase/integrase [Planctomycetaceae bacterium]
MYCDWRCTIVPASYSNCIRAVWRLLFGLSRFAGLRCPSEHLELRWADIDWARDRMIVRSPKTEHHDGRDCRVVPIFKELRPLLVEAKKEAPKDAEFVITLCRDSAINLRSRLTRIIEKAGLKPWPKLWQNLRSTRQTELASEFPIHAVCEWLGNSVTVAARHYLRVTESDFQRAAGLDKEGAIEGEIVHANYNASRMQNAMQRFPTVTSANSQESETDREIPANCVHLRDREGSKRLVHKRTVAGTGLEPVRP